MQVYIPGEGWVDVEIAYTVLDEGQHHLVVRDDAGDLEAEVIMVEDDESWIKDAA